MERLIQHDHGIYQVKTPVPFPLRYVNSYLLEDGSDGYVLIDPGLHNKETKEHWNQILAAMSISLHSIHKIIVTHHHPDHYGISGWFQQQTSAPVYMLEKAYESTMSFRKIDRARERLSSFYLEEGTPVDFTKELDKNFFSFDQLVSPHPEVTILNKQETLRIGERHYRLLETAGHASGHLCLYEPNEKIIFCADHVLQRITPNISYVPNGDDRNPLQSFIQDLQRLAKLDVVKAFPGHREPITNFSQRCEDIIQHHEERLHEMLESLNEPATTYDLCLQTFGTRLTTHQFRFAIGEVAAHLVYLVLRGDVKVERKNQVRYYSKIQ
ncbi:MBL fold metallo-hydrolase [Longirhabdus pacifica]|uniref:MBL fold metallo-hydrolase n=1 Tax=Longirhabdus pacifica TaxID=2305227 RepID=UPI0013E8D46E|nr:MBL fold metallo-hydrolase [Longirhabdus pacifica]